MRERMLRSYHARWFGRAIRGMFTTWGGVGSVLFAIGIPLVVARAQNVTWDEIGTFVLVTVGFLLAAFALQLIMAPRQMEKERTAAYEAQIAELRADLLAARIASEPSEAIRRINAHLEESRRIIGRLKRIPAAADEQEWTPALRECVDWVYGAGDLIHASCIGKDHEFGNLRRSIPTIVRDAGRNPDGSPWISGRNVRWRDWIAGGTNLLLDCIQRIESRPHA